MMLKMTIAISVFLVQFSAMAQETEKSLNGNGAKSVAQQEVSLPDFAAMFSFNSGYKNIVSLKTTGADRIFRMEGEKCYVEGVFSVQDALGGMEKAWIVPATHFARTKEDEKFCESGKKINVLIHKEYRKGFFGSAYRLGEFVWGRYTGTFEIN